MVKERTAHDALKLSRERRKHSQVVAGQLLGIRRNYVSMLEHGETPSGPLAARIERVYGIPASSWWPEAGEAA